MGGGTRVAQGGGSRGFWLLDPGVTFLNHGSFGACPRPVRALALRARDILCGALGIDPPAPDSMVGSMVAVPLPDAETESFGPPPLVDPLQEALWRDYGIEVPVQVWPGPPNRVLRVSAQVYNIPDHYARLAAALKDLGVP